MKRRILLVALLLAARPGSVAFADDLIVMAPGGLRGPFEQLAPDFERATGNKITLQFLSGGTVKESVTRGATFDVVVMQPPYDAALKSGNVVASSATQLASVAVGGAVKAGAARPDISTPEAVTKTLRAAKAIAFPNGATGATAGVTFDAMLDKLSLGQELAPKLKRAAGGAAAMAMVAKGDVDFGATFLSEMTDPGITILGPLPASIAPPTLEVAFVSAHTAHTQTAKDLIAFLSSAKAAEAYKAFHMIPLH